ncbi:MAG: right-handed parallel beta-helix repeat-containing protein [Planctomycetota bacterium]|nr:right-handed parallel beta-helix repeat-containing protein [Planctomycetota bacterium]
MGNGFYQAGGTWTGISGDWFSLIGNLQITELHDVAWDSNSDIIIGGAQDTGTPQQTAAGSLTWNTVTVADGGDVGVDTLSLAASNQSIRYSSTQLLGGFAREVYNAANNRVAIPDPEPDGFNDDRLALIGAVGLAGFAAQFVTPVAVNAVAPNRVVIGGTGVGVNPNPVYESLNAGSAGCQPGGGCANPVQWNPIPIQGGAVLGAVNGISAPLGRDANAMAYGGRRGGINNPGVLYVGSVAAVFVRTQAGGNLIPTAAIPFGTGGAGTITDVVMDPDNWATVYVTDNNQVFRGTNIDFLTDGLDNDGVNGPDDPGEMTWTEITGNLQDNNLRTIEYINVGGFVPGIGANVDAILVGGTSGVSRMLVGDEGNWVEFGKKQNPFGLARDSDLPNAPVYDLDYDATDNILLAGTLGRGAWLVRNVRQSILAEPILQITGDVDSNDKIRLVRNANNSSRLDVFINNDVTPRYSVPLTLLSRITIDAGQGTDIIILDYSNGDPNPPGGIEVRGGVGDDRLEIDDGDNCQFVGGTLTCPSQSYVIGSSFFLDPASFVRRSGVSAASYRGVETVIINADNGADDFEVEFRDDVVPEVNLVLNTGQPDFGAALAGTDKDTVWIRQTHGTVTVNGVSGDDDVIVGDRPAPGLFGTLQTIRHDLHISNDFGFTDLILNGSGDTVSYPDVTLNTDTITGLLPARATIHFEPADLSSLQINTGRGADGFTVADTPTRGATIDASIGDDTFRVQKTTGPIQIYGQSGVTDVEVGNLGSVSEIQGTVTIAPFPLLDSKTNLTVDASADQATSERTVTVGLQELPPFGPKYVISGLAPAVIEVGSPHLNELTVKTGDGPFTVKVVGTPDRPNSLTTLLMGSGNASGLSHVEVEATDGRLDVVADRGCFIGRAGSNTAGVQNINGFLEFRGSCGLLLDDSANTTARKGVVMSPGLVTGMAPADISFPGAAPRFLGGQGDDEFTIQGTQANPDIPLFVTTELDAGGGNDTINVERVALQSILSLGGGDGDDTFNVGETGSVGRIVGSLSIRGGGHDAQGDVLNINDSASFFNHTFTITDTSLRREERGFPGTSKTFLYTTIEKLVLNTDFAFGSIVNIDGTAAGTDVEVNSGQATDQFAIEVSGVKSDVTVHAGPTSGLRGTADSLTVNGATGTTELRPLELELTTAGGNRVLADEVETIHAVAQSGINSVAVLHDSPGSDTFTGLPFEGTMRGTITAGLVDYKNSVVGFEEVHAIATPNPATSDKATLRDPTGTATFTSGPGFLLMEAPMFRVTATNFDSADHAFVVVNTNDAGQGSLRQAMTAANNSTGSDTIIFNIPTSDPGFTDVDSAIAGGDPSLDVFVIKPVDNGLPPLIDDGTTIDGRTQTAFSGNTNPFGPEIVLDGSLAGANRDGFSIGSDNNAIFGFNIANFSRDGVLIDGGDNNRIAGNYIGTDPSGSVDHGNRGGIVLRRASNNTIGGVWDGAGNVISGNDDDGIVITELSNGNLVQGNFIGTDGTGTTDLGNKNAGIQIAESSNNNMIGGSSAARNIISGNGQDGIFFRSFAAGNVVQGNYIGTDVTGVNDLGNAWSGVRIVAAANTNTIGGLTEETRNVISGNDRHGIAISDSEGNQVLGNYIGTDANGTAKLRNDSTGVALFGASNNTIGGTAPGAGNVISGHDARGADGMMLWGHSDNNVIQGNFIGTDKSGTQKLGNTQGIHISVASNGNLIGGPAPNAGNVISGNNRYGIAIRIQSSDNVVAGNFIGVDHTGQTPLGNGLDGVWISSGGSRNVIGGSLPEDRNIISANGRDGVRIEVSPTYGGSRENRIEGNVISNNPGAGVAVLGDTSTGNSIRRNSIHSNVGLGIDLGDDGVSLNDPSDSDSGPNDLQNFPVISSVRSRPGGLVRVKGTLESRPSGTYRLDFYASTQQDSSGHGEGARWLSSVDVSTNARRGRTSFVVDVLANAGEWITATATEISAGQQGSTSEFAEAVTVPGSTVNTASRQNRNTPTPNASFTDQPSQLSGFARGVDAVSISATPDSNFATTNLDTASSLGAAIPDPVGQELVVASQVTDTGDPAKSDTIEFVIRVDNPYHNEELAIDVNDDGLVTPLDALLIINKMNAGGTSALPMPPQFDPTGQPLFDVNNDLFITPIDALLVINHLNQNQAAGEGEAVPNAVSLLLTSDAEAVAAAGTTRERVGLAHDDESAKIRDVIFGSIAPPQVDLRLNSAVAVNRTGIETGETSVHDWELESILSALAGEKSQ